MDGMSLRAPSAPTIAWRRSSLCASSGCVEFAIVGDDIAIRDSKHTDGAVLSYDRDEWRAFVAGVKAGEFDV